MTPRAKILAILVVIGLIVILNSEFHFLPF